MDEFVKTMNKINANAVLYDLVTMYPEVKDIMVKLGFENIAKPGMLQSVGRIMTIRKGADLKGIDWEKVEKLFKEHGFLFEEEQV